MTQESALAAAKQLAQFPSSGGVNPITADPADGLIAVRQAVDRISNDRPLEAVTDHTVAADGFRVVLAGTGAILSGAAAWVEGKSAIVELYYPWDATAQDPPVADRNDYRIERGLSSSIVLAMRTVRLATGQVLRLVTSGPHAADCSTIPAGYAPAFEALVAHFLLTLAANKAAQNTGNTGFPTDVVDRRSQAGEYYLRAKQMLDIYRQGAGLATEEAPAVAVSGFKDLDVDTGHPIGSLWHPKSRR
jgi:hypothetical protein